MLHVELILDKKIGLAIIFLKYLEMHEISIINNIQFVGITKIHVKSAN